MAQRSSYYSSYTAEQIRQHEERLQRLEKLSASESIFPRPQASELTEERQRLEKLNAPEPVFRRPQAPQPTEECHLCSRCKRNIEPRSRPQSVFSRARMSLTEKSLPDQQWLNDLETAFEGSNPSLVALREDTDAPAGTVSDVEDEEEEPEKPIPLPDKRQSRPVRAIRHHLWSVYRRLFSIIFLANAAVLAWYIVQADSLVGIDIWNLATAASANIFVSTTIRQDYIQGIIYRSAMLVPVTMPLRFRRIMAKTYENGGVHSGAGVCGTIWFIALTVVISIQYARGIFGSIPVLVLTYTLQALLLSIVILAYPAFRARQHNTFEMTHRFFGWTVTAVFWVVLGLLGHYVAGQQNTNAGLVLVKQPSFWFLLFTTIHTILPWLNLRRWEFDAEALSTHAVRFHFKRTLRPYTGIAISTSPLFEWHPFATLPSLVGEKTGGSLICSAAGDWTKSAVAQPRKYYWVKGIPKPGVLCLSLLFKKCVIVATGSGIGPCLSVLASPHTRNKCRILWSGPNPEQIFGGEIVECVKRLDPESVIINTRKQGRPDMLALTYKLYVESGAEAVFVISNPMLTRKIVYGMESRGVPAFGPIWDS